MLHFFLLLFFLNTFIREHCSGFDWAPRRTTIYHRHTHIRTFAHAHAICTTYKFKCSLTFRFSFFIPFKRKIQHSNSLPLSLSQNQKWSIKPNGSGETISSESWNVLEIAKQRRRFYDVENKFKWHNERTEKKRDKIDWVCSPDFKFVSHRTCDRPNNINITKVLCDIIMLTRCLFLCECVFIKSINSNWTSVFKTNTFF